MKLHIIQFADPKSYVNPAAVFSADPLDTEIADALRKAQEVIEGQWLANYTPQSYCILLLPEKLQDVGFQLYDNVRLIHLEDWDKVVNESEVVLVNSHLLSMLRTDEDNFFIEISNLSAKTLIDLSEDTTLIVAGLKNVQQKIETPVDFTNDCA